MLATLYRIFAAVGVELVWVKGVPNDPAYYGVTGNMHETAQGKLYEHMPGVAGFSQQELALWESNGRTNAHIFRGLFDGATGMGLVSIEDPQFMAMFMALGLELSQDSIVPRLESGLSIAAPWRSHVDLTGIADVNNVGGQQMRALWLKSLEAQRDLGLSR